MKRALVIGAAAGVALVLPAAAFAHAALLRTKPAASVTVNTPPTQVALVYSEAVEPRFAIVSVTDADAHAQTAGPRGAQRRTQTSSTCRSSACGRAGTWSSGA